MSQSTRWAAIALIGLAGGCKKSTTGPNPPPPPPPPTVQSVTLSPQTSNLASIGETATLTAEIRLSNGSTGNQAVTWTSSNPNIASVNGGVVTAVTNGQVTITGAVGQVSGTATVTVAQVATALRLFPTDTVIKGPFKLRGSAVDARGNVVANASLVWETLSPTIDGVDQQGNLTPQSTGVARIRLKLGNLNTTSIVRTVWNVTQYSDLFPLFEYTTSAGQRRARSDVSQAHADVRAALIGQVWTYLTTQLPSSGTAMTDMYFTTWRQIWTEFIPFCGGLDVLNSTAYSSCNTPHWQHFLIPENQPDDFALIVRFLARQFVLASHHASANTPWFMVGYSQWLAGGQLTGGQLNGAPQPVSIADFDTGDSQSKLEPLANLVTMVGTDFFADLPNRTPTAIRMAQAVMFVSYLNATYPTVLPGMLAMIRADPGAGVTNTELYNYVLTQTGKTTAELEAGYIAYARAL